MFTVILIDDFSMQYWQDEHLTWNPEEYGGQDKLSISADMIWKPDITAPNGPHVFRFENMEASTVLIRPTGHIEYWSLTQLKTYCMTDLRLFPEDTQRCRVTLEPFYTYNYVNLSSFAIDHLTTDVNKRVRIENPEWELINITSKIF